MKKLQAVVFVALVLSAEAGEVLYNGIQLPDEWPPQIDALYPGPKRPPYIKKKTRPAVIKIDLGRQLFVDDFLIETSNGLVRAYGKPTKYDGNPVLWPQTDDELARWTKLGDSPYPKDTPKAKLWDPRYKSVPASCFSGGAVWWDPKRGKYRMWYLSSWSGLLSTAESGDALHWERPKVGLNGTNVILKPDHIIDTFCVSPDFAAEDPYSNWLLYVSPGENPCRGYEYTSADGIHWTFRTRTGLIGDSSTVFYNPFRRKWVWSIRAAWRRRSRMYHEHDDFLNGAKWDLGCDTTEQKTGADPMFYSAKGWRSTRDCRLWLACDDADIQRTIGGTPRPCGLYNVDATPYESIMVGLFKIISGRDNDEAASEGMPKTTTIHFAYSRDGFHFTRPDRTPAIADSDWGSGAWDTGYLGPCASGFVVKDERLLFFYTAGRGDGTMKANPSVLGCGLHANMSIGIASLRRDGFVGMVADGEGELTTRPVVFTGNRLFVNVDARFGNFAAEVLDEEGKPVAGYSAEECRMMTREDSTKREIAFAGGDLARFAGKPVRFRFKLKVATLYSFWVSSGPHGKSGGYLSAGGPGYENRRDE